MAGFNVPSRMPPERLAQIAAAELHGLRCRRQLRMTRPFR